MKKALVTALAAMMAFSLAACGESGNAGSEAASENETAETEAQIANPWTDTTEEAARAEIPFFMKAPDGATDVIWRRMENGEYPLIELDFTYEGRGFTARVQYGASETDDISGMYIDWETTTTETLENWGGGNMGATLKTGMDDDAVAFLCSWYDYEIGVAYTLATTTQDDMGLDMAAIAAAMYDETKVPDFGDPEPEEAETAALPAYEYPGPEQFYFVLYGYLVDELSQGFAPSDVSIPCPVIVAEDDSDPDDIRVYGSFWIFNYDLNGDILENVSGGDYPGVVYMKSTDAGYEVTGMDVVEDGSSFTESAKEIFGEHYEDYIKLGGDEEERERIRAQIIANYVAANDLSITGYQDYGWDVVTLPEENIDSFYSSGL